MELVGVTGRFFTLLGLIVESSSMAEFVVFLVTFITIRRLKTGICCMAEYYYTSFITHSLKYSIYWRRWGNRGLISMVVNSSAVGDSVFKIAVIRNVRYSCKLVNMSIIEKFLRGSPILWDVKWVKLISYRFTAFFFYASIVVTTDSNLLILSSPNTISYLYP
jgi:hypothetical protein